MPGIMKPQSMSWNLHTCFEDHTATIFEINKTIITSQKSPPLIKGNASTLRKCQRGQHVVNRLLICYKYQNQLTDILTYSTSLMLVFTFQYCKPFISQQNARQNAKNQ